MSTYKPSPVIQANIDLLQSREQVGTQKYGVTLSDAGLNIKQLVQHLLEEQLDGANYAQALLQQLDNGLSYRDGFAERDRLLDALNSCLRHAERTPILGRDAVDMRREIINQVRHTMSTYISSAILRGIPT